MKIKIESTEERVEVNGTPCRVWKGMTEKGVPCLVYVATVAVEEARQQQQFAEELEAMVPPEILVRRPSRASGQDWR
jgi:hypothetical protein